MKSVATNHSSLKSACMSMYQQGPRTSARMLRDPWITEAGVSARFRRLAPSLRLLLLRPRRLQLVATSLQGLLL